jgi:glycosyltransferase involved in cell wall biosynthesis
MLSGTGHSVTIFVQDDNVSDYVAENRGPGIELLRFNSNRNRLHASLGYTARLSYAFADMVRTLIKKNGPPDIIEAQDYLGIAYYLTQFKHLGYPWLKGIPIVITLHSPAFIYLEYNRVPTFRFPDFWTGEMEKQAIQAADLLISPTRFLVEEIGRYMDISDKPVHVLANPFVPEKAPIKGPAMDIDAPDLTVAAGQDNPGGGHNFTRNKIVYYGKLSPQKGSFELLKYFRDLWDSGFPHALHVVGGTDIVYHPEILTMGQLVEKRYGPYIRKGLLQLHGKIRPRQIKEYLDDAHVILVPSIVDNLPYVVMEAMSLGKIVLASIQGGQREMIRDGITGFLFDHADPVSFERQLLKILALPDEAVQQLGLGACQSVKDNYSFGIIGPQKIKLLQDIKNHAVPDDYFPFLYQETTTTTPAVPAGDDLLSVVIPYYNMGAYIEECVRSVLDSTYQHLEILIVNDGSIDKASLEKLEVVAGLANVRVLHRKNQGLALTRNEGARQARGAFLAFLDADDKVAPLYYEKAIKALQKNKNVYFAGSWVQYFENSSQLWPTFTPQPPYALVHNPVNSSGLVYKRAAFLAGGLNDPKVDYGLEDYESVISMLRQGFNGVILPESLFYYRVRSGSMFRAITREKLLYSNKYITEKHADYYTKFAVQTVNLLNANGPGYLFDNPTFEVRVSSQTAKENALFLKMKSFVKGSQRLKKIVLTIKKIKS